MSAIRLGLIGDNIAPSQAPRLHRLAGRLAGLDVTYDLLVPRALGLDFDATFAHAAAAGYRGVNVTLPYKERAVAKVRVDDPLTRAIGAVNTVLFEPDGPAGHNTDYSGFVAACRQAFGGRPPEPVCLIGAGGVGKAVAFGLLALEVEDIRIAERDLPKAAALADALRAARPGLRVRVTDDVARAADGARGLVNGTPVGMVGYGGTPLPKPLMAGAAWAFDAVYTPLDTQFLADAAATGLTVVSGYELFFYQGVDAFRLFSGREADQGRLRAALLAGHDVPVR